MIEGSQKYQLLDYLRKRGAISCPTARRELGIESPAARIVELKGLGHNIHTEYVAITATNGKKKRLAVYRLIED